MPAIIILLIIAVFIPIWILVPAGQRRRIDEFVAALGGEVIEAERCYWKRGPFVLVGEDQTVYRFTYRINGEVKEGWVKFRGIMGPDWRI